MGLDNLSPRRGAPTVQGRAHAVAAASPVAAAAVTAALVGAGGAPGVLLAATAMGALAGGLTLLFFARPPGAAAPNAQTSDGAAAPLAETAPSQTEALSSGGGAGPIIGPLAAEASAAAAALAGPSATVAEAMCDARSILEQLPIALLLLDRRGRVVFANPEAEKEVDRSLVGEHFAASLRAPALADAVADALANEPWAEVDFVQRRYQERHIHAAVRGLNGSRKGDQGSESALYGQARVAMILQDVTHARRAEQVHRDFVANASHELKTPLAALGGFIETLQESAKDDPAARERFLAIMAQQADRMRRLVDDLLSLNRIELGEHVPPRDDLDLRRLTLEAVAQMSAFEEGRIEMDLHGVDAPLTVRGDAAQLEQAVVNLVENALKYGGDARPIRVTAAERTDPRRQIGLRVEDSGPGIPKEHLPRLTERFYRVERASERQASGTGLGLSIVKHVVSRHRGALEVESRPGRGSRFTLWLPPAEEFDIASSPDI